MCALHGPGLEFRHPVSGVLHAIVNPAAGGGRAGRRASEALAELRGRGASLRIEQTEAPKHATALAKEAAEGGQRRFLSVGGDGTASEVVNGLVMAGVAGECELGMLPLGTGNSFLRDFGITSVEDAIRAIARGGSRPIDVLRLTHDEGVVHFINTMGTGFIAQAGELTNARFKVLGAAGYIAAVLICIARLDYQQNTLEYAGEIDDAQTILTSISNTQYTGGTMWMAPAADPSDGLLDLVRAGRLSRIELTGAFAQIFKGTHTQHDGVWTRQLPRLEFVNPSHQPVLIDGDLFHLTPRAVDVLPSALRLIA